MTEAVRAVHSMVDENVNLIFSQADERRLRGARMPQVACKKGCDYCCNFRVKTSVPEVLTIADRIRATFTEQERADLMRRIESNLASFEGLSATQRLNKMMPCPLLVNHACSVHAFRPIFCRSHHSVNVDACKQGLIHPDKVQIPHFLEVDTVVEPIAAGITEAMSSRHLKSHSVYLAPALKIALNDPAARDKWLSGQDVFASAVDKGIEQLIFLKTAKRLSSIEI